MHSRGDGVLASEAEAIRWYELAAEQGDAPAQTNLGVTLAQRWYRRQRDGREDPLPGVGPGSAQQELILAFKWLVLAAAQENVTARTNLGVLEEWLSPGEISEARRLAAEWLARRSAVPPPRTETIRPPGR
jgi:TPR repeat protein